MGWLLLHGSDQEVGTGGFDVAGLEARIAAAEPANLAFNGKNAAQGALGRRVAYGPQPERIAGAAVWVLPSTSGAARGYWDAGSPQRHPKPLGLSRHGITCS